MSTLNLRANPRCHLMASLTQHMARTARNKATPYGRTRATIIVSPDIVTGIGVIYSPSVSQPGLAGCGKKAFRTLLPSL